MEANPEVMKSLVEHEKVPKEEAAVETFGTKKEWYRDWHLAVGRFRQPKNRPRAMVGPGRNWPLPAEG
jgi:hypothetical protein